MDVDVVDAWPSTWLGVAGEVLEEPRVDEARARLAAALLAATGGTRAARVHIDTSGAVSWYLTDRRGVSTTVHVPALPGIEEHPFHGYHVEEGATEPARLTDVIAAGRPLSADALPTMDRLGLSVHQLSVPVEQPGVGTGYDGWLLLHDEHIADETLRTVRDVQPLLRGLDRHLRLLGALLPVPADPLLTPREKVVLSMLAEGCTVGSAARRLLISPRTVHKHQEHLYRKLGAVDRLSAVLRAQELGLLPRQQPRLPVVAQ